MFSSQPINNSRRGTLVDAVTLGDFSVRKAACAPYYDYVGNVLFGQFSVCHLLPTGFDRMSVIPNARNPFKISPDIVRLNLVDVVDFGQSKRIGNKGSRDESVDGHVSADWGVPKPNVHIPSLVDAQPQQSASVLPPAASLSFAGLIQTTNAPKVADFVASRKFNDRNRAPFLRNLLIHVTHLVSRILASLNMASTAGQGGFCARSIG